MNTLNIRTKWSKGFANIINKKDKNFVLKFFGADFSMPKSSHQCEN